MSEGRRQAREAVTRPPISEDDYFRRNAEFRAWLLTHHRHFDELTSEKSRKYFRKFVEKWNSGSLKESIYELEEDARRKGKQRPSSVYQTSHTWSFAKDSKVEESQGREERNAVDHGRSDGTKSLSDMEWKRKRKDDLDELCPKPDPGSFAARIEKRARNRPSSPGGVREVDDRTLMGEDRNIHDLIRRRKERREDRANRDRRVAEDRLQELQEKERRRMEEFKSRLGLS